MALTRDFRKTLIERSNKDPKFRVVLLKQLIKMAMEADPHLLAKALLKLEPSTKKR